MSRIHDLINIMSVGHFVNGIVTLAAVSLILGGYMSALGNFATLA